MPESKTEAPASFFELRLVILRLFPVFIGNGSQYVRLWRMM
jgi:hypothetical protein